MKLTTARLKKLIREELKNLNEGVNYTNKFTPDSAAIYYMDEEPQLDYEDNPLPLDVDITKAQEAMKNKNQSVPFGTKIYNQMKDYYDKKGYKFQKSPSGASDLVKPPGHDDFVEFVFRYVKREGV